MRHEKVPVKLKNPTGSYFNCVSDSIKTAAAAAAVFTVSVSWSCKTCGVHARHQHTAPQETGDWLTHCGNACVLYERVWNLTFR